MMERLTIRTARRDDMIDITHEVGEILRRTDVEKGLCCVFVPHTTAGVTINEHADPDVATDLLAAIDRAVPWNGSYRHGEGNSAAHAKATMTGSSATIIVEGGKLQLGTWQGIFLCEFDGPRTRHVWVSILAA